MLFAAPASAFDGEEERPRLLHYSTSSLISNPGGYSLRADMLMITGALPQWFDQPILGDFALGGYNTYYVFSDEIGITGIYETDPGFFRTGFDIGVEPGRFIYIDEDDEDRSNAAKNRLTRRAGARYVARAVTTFNLRYAGVWLYARNTVWYRYRPFKEWDFRYEFAYDRHEAGIEQALALMFNFIDPPSRGPADRPDAHVWLYAEYTVGYIYPGGTMPNRISMGMITEHFPVPYVGWNLDVFYSFAPRPQDGLGIILVSGFTFESFIDYRRL